MELPLLVAGARPKEARRRATAALETVGVPEQAHKRPNEMSGGQQQRVTVARSLVNDPAIVWADEPTGALDSETSAEIVDLLVRLNREQGQTFVLVTHDASVAAPRPPHGQHARRHDRGRRAERRGGPRWMSSSVYPPSG